MTSLVAVGPNANTPSTNEPSGSLTTSVTPGIVFSVTESVTSWPAVAANVRTAFSPGVPIVTSVGTPIEIVPVFAGTSLSVKVIEPVPPWNGSTVSEYVPATGSSMTSPNAVGSDTNHESTNEPSGSRTIS